MKNHQILFKVAGWFLFLLGIILILLGILGMFLPFFPGTILILAGLALIGEKRVHNWIKSKFHK